MLSCNIISKDNYLSFRIHLADIMLHPLDITIGDKRKKAAMEEFVRRACMANGDLIKSITVFGSTARGTDRPDSDIDLLVVVDNEDFRLRRDLIGMAFEIMLDTGMDISVKVLSIREFEARKSYSFLQNVLSEGIRVV